jgi:predicted Na+-dependent transporter
LKNVKSLKNISIYLLIPFTLAVLLPALYLNGIDDGTHEWEIIAVFSISYIFVIQALRRRDFINRKSFTLIIACVLFFVIGDTLFGFDLYHNMPYVYEISNIFYFLAQYVLIYSVQAQYFEKPELKKYVDERKTNSKKEENMHLR